MPSANEHMIVVGGTSGIGLAIAQSAHKLGRQVTITGRGSERAAEIASSIGSDVAALPVDLEDSATIRAAFVDGPPIDHLVITPIHRLATSVKSFDAQEARRLAEVKLIGYVEVVQAALPRLKPSSSIVLFGGLAKANPYLGSTMTSIVMAALSA